MVEAKMDVTARVNASLARELAEARKAVTELVEALRLTVEYVGTQTLPPIPGWEWYDALSKHLPEYTQPLRDADEARRRAARSTEEVAPEPDLGWFASDDD